MSQSVLAQAQWLMHYVPHVKSHYLLCVG